MSNDKFKDLLLKTKAKKYTKQKKPIVIGDRNHSKTIYHIVLLCENLMANKNDIYYISTKNKEWFKQRFKDATGRSIELVDTNSNEIFQIKLIENETNRI